MALMVKYGPPRGMWPEFKLDFPEAEKWPEKLNVTQFLIDKNIIEGRGDKTAILHGSQRITFNELYENGMQLQQSPKKFRASNMAIVLF